MRFSFSKLLALECGRLLTHWGMIAIVWMAGISPANAQFDENDFIVPYHYLAVSRDWVQKELELTPEQRRQIESSLTIYRKATEDYFIPLWVRQPDTEGRAIQRNIYAKVEAVMEKSAKEIAIVLTDGQKKRFPKLMGRLTTRIECPYEILIIDCNQTQRMRPLTAAPNSRDTSSFEKVRTGENELIEDSLRDLSKAGREGYVQLRMEWQRWEPLYRDRFLSLMSEDRRKAWLAGEPKRTKKRFYGATFVRGEPALVTAENGDLTLAIDGWDAKLLRKGKPTGIRVSHDEWHFIQHYAFSPDGTRLATVAGKAPFSVGSGFTSELCIWDTQTGKCLMQAHSHGRFGKVSFPENEFVIFSSDGVVF